MVGGPGLAISAYLGAGWEREAGGSGERQLAGRGRESRGVSPLSILVWVLRGMASEGVRGGGSPHSLGVRW